jgi:long-chain acyl-CoA synthetase
VILSHANLISNTESILAYLPIKMGSSVAVTLPFSYSYGNSLLLTHIMAGGTLIIAEYAAFPANVAETLCKSEPTGFSTVGSYLNLFLKQIPLEKTGFDKLKYITFAGESTYENDIKLLHKNYPQLQIYIMYGQTEASARLSYLHPEMIMEKPGSIGKSILNVEMKIVSEDGNAVEPGTQGELIVRGPNIMTGYWNDPESTNRILIDGWLHTGDIARMDEEGYFYICGRRDDMIKYMGHRISPLEIENIINGFPGILESAVVGIKDSARIIIRAYMTVSGNVDRDLFKAHLKAYVSDKLPSFKRPHQYHFLDKIPRTPNNKIQRKLLRDLSLCVESQDMQEKD